MGATATDPQAGPAHAEHRLTTLGSGLRIVTERIPSVRSAALGFWVASGSASEREDEAGISHLLEHMLFRGTEHFGSEEIDQIFDAMGAEINAGTDRESTSLYTRVLDGHLERAFEVMSEMIWEPRYGELEAERQVVLEEIAMYEDDPQDLIFDVLGRAIFGSHPLGRPVIGRAEVVAGATRELLGAFHDRRYLPRTVVIAAAGSVDHDRLVALAESSPAPTGPPAGGERADGDGSSTTTIAAPVPEPRARLEFLQKDTEQYHVCLGAHGLAREDERRFALRVLEGILGGTSSSRLFQEVRERRGLAYAIFSFSNLYAHAGEVGLYVGTRPDNLGEALRVVAAELERLVEDPASEQELVRSRENLKGRVVLGMESTGARMSRLGSSLLHGMPILSVDEMIARIDAVELDDLRALAGELFTPERMSVVGIGPERERMLDALAPLSLGAREAANGGAGRGREAASRDARDGGEEAAP
ncbi:MAG TPA: pitrilysin family protein [Solirubrobacteraceae bacterium]|nr:pitrilysin family protein [Solirubrobacteraceae bacterium]